MIAEMKEALQPHLSAILGRDAELSEPVLLAGGASKEAWAVDAGGEALLVRRAAGSVIHRRSSAEKPVGRSLWVAIGCAYERPGSQLKWITRPRATTFRNTAGD